MDIGIIDEQQMETTTENKSDYGGDLQLEPREIENRFVSCIPPVEVLERLDEFELDSQISLSALMIEYNLIFHGSRAIDGDMEEIYSHELFDESQSAETSSISALFRGRIESISILPILRMFSKLEIKIRQLRELNKSFNEINEVVIQFSIDTLPIFDKLNPREQHAIMKYCEQSRRTITPLFASRSRTLGEQTRNTNEYADYQAKHPKKDFPDSDSDD